MKMKMKKIEMSDESYEKGRKNMSMTTLGKEMSMGGSVPSCWKGPAQKPGGIRSQQAPGTSDHRRTDQ
jgi:hypothetical protein